MRTNLVKTSQPRAWQSRVCPPKFSQVSGLVAFASQLASLKYTKSSSVRVCVCTHARACTHVSFPPASISPCGNGCHLLQGCCEQGNLTCTQNHLFGNAKSKSIQIPSSADQDLACVEPSHSPFTGPQFDIQYSQELLSAYYVPGSVLRPEETKSLQSTRSLSTRKLSPSAVPPVPQHTRFGGTSGNGCIIQDTGTSQRRLALVGHSRGHSFHPEQLSCSYWMDRRVGSRYLWFPFCRVAPHLFLRPVPDTSSLTSIDTITTGLLLTLRDVSGNSGTCLLNEGLLYTLGSPQQQCPLLSTAGITPCKSAPVPDPTFLKGI